MSRDIEELVFGNLPESEVETVVDMMLASIGLEVVTYESFAGFKYLRLDLKSRHGEVLCHAKDYFFIEFISTKQIAMALVSTIDYFVLDGKERAKNPYLGCKSLEEVMIRKDLTCLKQT